jgi:AcrR family transcriptional regulator
MAVKRVTNAARRSYVSPLRKQQASTTARLIVESAHRLFVANGDGGTAMTEIAKQAGVAERTVYAAFKSKRALLFAVVDAAIASDSDPEPVAGRSWFRVVIDQDDPHRKLELFASAVRAIHERTSSIFQVIQEAATTDPAVAEILAAHREGQAADERLVVDSLREDALREDLDRDDVLETIWVLTTPLFYAQAIERGWTPERYERWLADTLRRLLLADRDAT